MSFEIFVTTSLYSQQHNSFRLVNSWRTKVFVIFTRTYLSNCLDVSCQASHQFQDEPD